MAARSIPSRQRIFTAAIRAAFRIGPFGVGMHAAVRAEAMLDDAFVERVGARVPVRRQEAELVVRHEPEQRAFALADRAVAGHRTLEGAFDLEGDAPAMAATFVLHECAPGRVNMMSRSDRHVPPRSSGQSRQNPSPKRIVRQLALSLSHFMPVPAPSVARRDSFTPSRSNSICSPTAVPWKRRGPSRF